MSTQMGIIIRITSIIFILQIFQSCKIVPFWEKSDLEKFDEKKNELKVITREITLLEANLFATIREGIEQGYSKESLMKFAEAGEIATGKKANQNYMEEEAQHLLAKSAELSGKKDKLGDELDTFQSHSGASWGLIEWMLVFTILFIFIALFIKAPQDWLKDRARKAINKK